MKLNTVLMTSAATLMATSAVFAADLPSKKAAATSGSVQVCKVAGKTGFQLPGSDTCVVLSGYVWAEAKVGDALLGSFSSGETTSSDDNFDAKVRQQLNVDTYSNTELGVLHGNIALRGNYTSEGGSSFAIPNAYIQLGGLTVGLLDSTFGMLDGSPSVEAPNHTPSTTPVQIGYSTKLGNGVTLGLALEEQRSVDEYAGYTSLVAPSTIYSAPSSGFNQMPDVVGTIDFSLSNADIHLGAAYHDNNFAGHNYDAGYAFDAGVKFNLDSIAKGDSVAVEYAYADGATSRLATIWDSSDLGYDTNSWGDYYTVGYSVGAQFTHSFSSNLKGTVFGGYNHINYDEGNISSSTVIGANLDFQPAKNFHIKPEVFAVTNKKSGDWTAESYSAQGAVLRIQRDF